MSASKHARRSLLRRTASYCEVLLDLFSTPRYALVVALNPRQCVLTTISHCSSSRLWCCNIPRKTRDMQHEACNMQPVHAAANTAQCQLQTCTQARLRAHAGSCVRACVRSRHCIGYMYRLRTSFRPILLQVVRASHGAWCTDVMCAATVLPLWRDRTGPVTDLLQRLDVARERALVVCLQPDR